VLSPTAFASTGHDNGQFPDLTTGWFGIVSLAIFPLAYALVIA